MKAKLIFDVPEERKAFMAAAKADDMAIVLWNIVFNQRKEAHEIFVDGSRKFSPRDIVNGIFDDINNTLERNGIIIDDLTE